MINDILNIDIIEEIMLINELEAFFKDLSNLSYEDSKESQMADRFRLYLM